jgi:hypothetical protein
MSTSQPPASQSTPPPPKSSSTPFIVAVVAMLLLMGGLLFWKLSGSKQAGPAATVAAPPSVAAAPPALEEPPPPPPPPEPETPDAGTEPNKGAKKVASTGGGGCSADCTGTPAPQFASQLQALAGRARGCYERALQHNEQLGGRLSVSIKVGTSGQACSANVTSNQTGDPGLSTCVAQIFRSSTYAAPKNGCVDAQVPLNFVPKK